MFPRRPLQPADEQYLYNLSINITVPILLSENKQNLWDMDTHDLGTLELKYQEE
jgi:hypothetical protein